MTCYHPLAAYKLQEGGVSFKSGDGVRIGLPCGKCTGCLARRAQDWALRVMHEAQMWQDNCFVTLTYGRDKVPAGGSLCYLDFQLFMKRLRRYREKRPLFCCRRGRRLFPYLDGPVRFFMCGEYGPLNLRPHYHACLFNVDFNDKVASGKSGAGAVFFDSPTLERLWSHGIVSVQQLNASTAMYCSKYLTKKVTQSVNTGDRFVVDVDGECHTVAREFSRCSLKPGIGAQWYSRFGGDVFPHDFVVADGRRHSPPKYYDKLFRRSKDIRADEVEYQRELRARAGVLDQTPERLAVREIVHNARVRNGKRDL